MTALTVVLITRNQEWNVARLVESVLRETDRLPETEIVLVDSASTDATTEIAARYPIHVLKLRADQRLTAAAGRFVGYQRTAGEFVLFLDGDMELRPGWLAEALGLMRSRPDVAGVTGVVVDRPRPSVGASAQVPGDEPRPAAGGMMEVRHGGGAAMYRRAVLEQVGPFNPYLYCDEEPELGLRIRSAGHRIIRLPCPVVFHLDPWRESTPGEALAALLNKRRARLFLGFGQNIRYFLGSRLLWRYLRERGWVIAPALALAAGLAAAAAWALTGAWVWPALWAGLLAALTLATAARKRSVKAALLTQLRRLLILEGTLRGVLMRPDAPAAYPGHCDVIA